MNNDKANSKYHSSFLYILMLFYLAWLPVILVTVFLNPTLGDFIGITLSGAVFVSIAALVWVLMYPVAINENGLRIRSSNGRVALLNWHEIVRIRPKNLLFFKYLKLFNNKNTPTDWTSFTLQNNGQFAEDIVRYAPEGHPLRVYIETGEIVETPDIDNTVDYEKLDGSDEKSIEERLKTQNTLKGGANWFYWIAGLSLINTAIFVFGGNWSFVVGLSITQVIDAAAYGISQSMPSNFAGIMMVFSVIADIMIAGVFILFGYFANKRRNWSFIAGMMLYTADALISLAFKDFLSAGFHALALFGIYSGLKANKRLP